MAIERRLMSGVLAGLALLVCGGATGCGSFTADVKHPRTNEYVTVNLDSVREDMLPCEFAWNKLRQSINRSKGAGGFATTLLFGRETAADVERRLEAMSDDARKGQAGSSPVDAFDDIVPEIAAWLARDLPKHTRIEKAVTKQVLVVAPVANQLNNGAAAKIEGLDAALATLGTRLMSNEAVKNNFICLSEDSGGAEVLKKAVGGEQFEVRDPAASGSGKQLYSPDSVFLVTPRIYQTNDANNGRITIMMDVRVQHPQTRQDLLAHTSKRQYFYQPYQKKWLSLAQEGELQTMFWAKYDAKARK